jgi:hypothetical protein
MSHSQRSIEGGREIFLEQLATFVRSLGLPQPHESIYHKTSPRGLLGILESRSIWATGIAYLNDTSEIALALDLVFVEMQRRMAAQELRADLFELLRYHMDSPLDEHIFVASFSAERDDLSQWRGYCPDAGGYALGVSADTLVELGARGFASLVPVLYEPEQQQNLIGSLLAATLSLESRLNAMESLSPQRQEDHLVAGFKSFLGIIAPMIKDRAFHHEREWRLVVNSGAAPLGTLKFRVGRSIIIPFVALSLSEPGARLHVPEVVVGPTGNPDPAIESVKLVLQRSGISFGAVTATQIPYRSAL